MSRIPDTLTRKDLVRRVAKHTKMPQHLCKPWVDAVLACFGNMFMEADPELRIELRNHGVYTVKRTSARLKARNPRTGESVRVPSRRKVHFKPSKHIKRFLDQPLDAPEQEDPPQYTA